MHRTVLRIDTKTERAINVTVIALLLLLFSVSLGACTSSASNGNLPIDSEKGRTLTISTASSLIPVFEEIGAAYLQERGISITLNSGATTQLAQQIEQGAPVDLFIAADALEITRLEQQKHLVPSSPSVFALGSLILWSQPNFQIQSINDLALPSIQIISLANPQIAPYGRAAEEVLYATGLYSQIEPKLVFGGNVRQAMQFAETGDADIAFTSLSLGILADGNQLAIPRELYSSLEQVIAIVATSPNMTEAETFIAFLHTQEAQALLTKYGYTVPN